VHLDKGLGHGGGEVLVCGESLTGSVEGSTHALQGVGEMLVVLDFYSMVRLRNFWRLRSYLVFFSRPHSIFSTML
jgi:hypothetical protein